jgi:hypothetical protein
MPKSLTVQFEQDKEQRHRWGVKTTISYKALEQARAALPSYEAAPLIWNGSDYGNDAEGEVRRIARASCEARKKSPDGSLNCSVYSQSCPSDCSSS